MDDRGDDPIHHGPSWAYVLVSGDALVSSRLPWILGRLDAYGLEPRVAGVLRFGVEEMCAIYGGSPDELVHMPLSGGESISFSLQTHDDLYALVPACLVTVHHPGGTAIDALARCKGTTQPEISGDGTIRQGGENVVFNLVHAPDSEADARAELTRLLGADVAYRLAVDADRPAGDHPCGIDSVGVRLPAFCGTAAASVPLIVNCLRGRIVQRLALDAAPASQEELVQITRTLVTERQRLLRLDSPRARLQEAQRGTRGLDDALRAAAAPVGDPLLSRGSTALSELLDLDGERRPEDIWGMRGLIFISPLEWVFLRGHSHGFRGNEILRSIYGVVS
jgi:hypothetical protein